MIESRLFISNVIFISSGSHPSTSTGMSVVLLLSLYPPWHDLVLPDFDAFDVLIIKQPTKTANYS
jgi:hypothetical protein